MPDVARSRIWKASKILAAAAVVVVYLSAWLFGAGGRVQFSPDTLEFRGQREWREPLLMVPIYRSRWEMFEKELVQYLVSHGYWSSREVAEPEWIGVYHANLLWRDGWTTMYHDVYCRPETWVKWTEENPELATIVWPRVLELFREQAGEDSYVVELLRQAQQSVSRREFERRMAQNIDWPAGLAYLPQEGLPKIRIDLDAVDEGRGTKN
jgi:hypothetical protein